VQSVAALRVIKPGGWNRAACCQPWPRPAASSCWQRAAHSSPWQSSRVPADEYLAKLVHTAPIDQCGSAAMLRPIELTNACWAVPNMHQRFLLLLGLHRRTGSSCLPGDGIGARSAQGNRLRRSERRNTGARIACAGHRSACLVLSHRSHRITSTRYGQSTVADCGIPDPLYSPPKLAAVGPCSEIVSICQELSDDELNGVVRCTIPVYAPC
jgi:hypothetical protein